VEPVVSRLYRHVGASEGGEDELVTIDIHTANKDTAVAGTCPYNPNPDRTVTSKSTGALMSFGDRKHRCPGAHVAMQESAIFLDKLLRVPGIKLVGEPMLGWHPVIEGYEIRQTRIACDTRVP